jgi:twitching motility protein PilT
MSLVPSLLQAIVGVDGEALVMHAGDKPYVVAPSGQIELASRGLTLDAVNGIVSQLLPADALKVLEEFGAIQQELPAQPEFPGESFTVVAARGGDDVWVEIRRRKISDDDGVPDEFFAPAPAPGAQVSAVAAPGAVASSPESFDVHHEVLRSRDLEEEEQEIPIDLDSLDIPDAAQLFEGPSATETTAGDVASSARPEPPPAHEIVRPTDVPESAPWVAPVTAPPLPAPPPAVSAPVAPVMVAPPVATAPVVPIPVLPPPVASAPVAPPPVMPSPVASAPVVPTPVVPPPVVSAPVAPASVTVSHVEPPPVASAPVAPTPVVLPPIVSAPVAPPPATVSHVEPPPIVRAPVTPQPVASTPAPPVMVSPPVAPAPVASSRVVSAAPVSPPPVPSTPIAPAMTSVPATPAATVPPVVEPPAPMPAPFGSTQQDFKTPAPYAVVLPISRSPIRSDTPPQIPVGVSGLDRLLRMAAARGASTLYLSSDARPSVRVDGEIQMLEGEPSHGPNDVESLLLTLMPDRNHEALRSGVATEWISDVDGVGRVRCLSFRDHRGPGGVFRMMPVRAVSSEQLGLPGEVQALALESGGLVLVAGSRLSGKRTMISALVDLVNHTRRDHVITIESEINVVHERGTSFISQREVRGSYDDVAGVARAVLREDPDVLVIESMRTAPLINVALEAAASGQLVLGGFPAHNTTAAVDRIINLYPPENRRQVQLALAENLKGIVAQVLLRKIGGGRLAAREVLLNTPAVAGIIAEGRTSQLPLAIEAGRRQGMMPLNDALVGFVQSGVVDVREAYRRAADRAGFLVLLKRMGMDTTAIERMA